MAVTLEQFVERLTASGLMSAGEVSPFHDSLPPEQRPRDVQALATQLVKAGKLTKYQAQAIYQGRHQGLVFGEYVVLDKLGEGGMGVVLKAQHRRMKRLVAVKMISQKALGSPGAVKRFYREVEAAARLNHPNIVQAHDASEHNGCHYLVMEYVEGKDLAAMVKENGPLPVAQAVECIVQAARGLEYAHKQNIVHRDIKPSNLLVDKEGTVKVLDMGLARVAGLAEADDQDRLTASGQVVGTCDYMAPEQAIDTHSADRRADIYSLGCTLYRLLTGEVPYQGETLMQILIGHQQSPIPSLRKALPEVPPPLDAVFQKMVAKRPDDRQQTMAEVIAELEACMAERFGAARSLAEQSSSNGGMGEALSFLQGNPRAGTTSLAKAKAPPSHAETIAYAPEGQPERPASLPQRMLATVRKKPLLAAAAVGLGLAGVVVGLFAITLRIQHPDGKETVMQVPEGADVRIGKDGQVDVALPKNKAPATQPQGKSATISNPKSQIPNPPSAGRPLPPSAEPWELSPGSPPPAIAPFDAQKAKEHQEAWAKYLKLPVETTNAVGMKLVLIPPGEFTMNDGNDAHRVRITKPFYLGKYEVTQEEWEAVMGSNPSQFKGPKKPVERMNWDDCQEYLDKLSKKCATAQGSYRLPTEAQWEYACRAGTTGRWFFGDTEAELGDYGWYKDNSEQMTHVVGEKQPNGWGLHDVYGNVHEWCVDWNDDHYYKVSPLTDPAGPVDPPPTSFGKGPRRVDRGGGWNDASEMCRSARRNHRVPGDRNCYVGLRACQVLADKPIGQSSLPFTSAGPAQTSKPAPAITTPSAAVGAKPSPFVGLNGEWKLPPGAPPPAIAPFDAQKAKEHQEAWAKFLNLPVETTNAVGMKLVLIPPGEFTMGEGGDAHRVRITKPFYLGKYEVTQEEWEAVMGSNPSQFQGPKNPVERVSWDDCQEYLDKLSQKCAAAAGSYRLPTEAQWEYACRAGTTGKWFFGDTEADLVDYGWYKDNSEQKAHVVGEKQPNGWGLHDVYGNVQEWCVDWHDKDYYKRSPLTDPVGPDAPPPTSDPKGPRRVGRGGYWGGEAVNCRSARRYFDEPGYRNRDRGLRACQVLAEK